jgi:hypothetical protein
MTEEERAKAKVECMLMGEEVDSISFAQVLAYESLSFRVPGFLQKEWVFRILSKYLTKKAMRKYNRYLATFEIEEFTISEN